MKNFPPSGTNHHHYHSLDRGLIHSPVGGPVASKDRNDDPFKSKEQTFTFFKERIMAAHQTYDINSVDDFANPTP